MKLSVRKYKGGFGVFEADTLRGFAGTRRAAERVARLIACNGMTQGLMQAAEVMIEKARKQQ